MVMMRRSRKVFWIAIAGRILHPMMNMTDIRVHISACIRSQLLTIADMGQPHGVRQKEKEKE
jgi:hypothetical protein